jgi:predicted transcriptional regulator with HTH domain
MKGESRLKVLAFMKGSAKLVDDLFFIFSLPYGTSLSRMTRLLQTRQSSPLTKSNSREIKKRFYDLMYHLKKDGLVCKSKKEGGAFFSVTTKGKSILKKLRSDRAKNLPDSCYKFKIDKTLKIVIFDIPEKEKRKREWLRSVLRNLNFDMLQKSVWVGKAKLPQEFMADLKRLNILSSVEFFSVDKSGSLKQS